MTKDISMELLIINEYQLEGGTAPLPVNVVLRRMPQMEGPEKWAIQELGCSLNKKGRWEWDPQPSSRTNAYLRRCRFDNPQEALTFWVKHCPTTRFSAYITVNSKEEE